MYLLQDCIRSPLGVNPPLVRDLKVVYHARALTWSHTAALLWARERRQAIFFSASYV